MKATHQRLDDCDDYNLLNENMNATNRTQILVAARNEIHPGKN
jgi:hypothetical protein